MLYFISNRPNPTPSKYVYGNLIVLSHPKEGCVSDEIKQSHAELNIMQGKASHTRRLGQLLLSCRNVSLYTGFFRRLGRGGCSPQDWGSLRGLRWFLLFGFTRKHSFVCWRLWKSNFLRSRSVGEREGAWSTDSNWGQQVSTMRLFRSSGYLFVSDGLYFPCKFSR